MRVSEEQVDLYVVALTISESCRTQSSSASSSSQFEIMAVTPSASSIGTMVNKD